MASSIYIKPESFYHLSESQICMWRKYTYNNLGEQKQFTLDDLKKYTIETPPSIEYCLDEIKKQVIQSKITGKLSYSNSTFVYIDSSTMCRVTIPTIIKKMFIKYPKIKKTNIIIIFSEIAKAENLYKFTTNYPNVNYKHLQFNLDLLYGKIEFKMKNIDVIHTNIYFDNKLLMNEEYSYLLKYLNWQHANIKNELNDNAQIEMMVMINKYFNLNNSVFISHDNGICNKIQQLILSTPRMHIIESNDFI